MTGRSLIALGLCLLLSLVLAFLVNVASSQFVLPLQDKQWLVWLMIAVTFALYVPVSFLVNRRGSGGRDQQADTVVDIHQAILTNAKIAGRDIIESNVTATVSEAPETPKTRQPKGGQ